MPFAPQRIIGHLDPDDDDLISRARQRDPAALDELLRRHLPELQAFVRVRVGERLASREEPDDIVQSACREVLQDLSSFRGGGMSGFRAWLLLAAARKVTDRARFWTRERRDGHVEQPLEDGDALDVRTSLANLLTPSRVAAGREELAAFEAAFDELSEEQRGIVVSSKLLGLSHSEISAATGRTEGAVRVALHRALARLGRLLEERDSNLR